LKQIHTNENAALLGTVSSVLFHRGIRVFLPLVASTFIAALLLQLNPHPGGKSTFSAQMWGWYARCKSSSISGIQMAAPLMFEVNG
jgi:hypothetical protein